MLELLIARPDVDVAETEYRRLLGYPREHVPSERSLELSAWARQWYAHHGRPWIFVREVSLSLGTDALRFEGTEFRSPQLRDHLRSVEAQRVVLIAVSAGRNCEEHARQLWQESKPDEYFFLEIYASAVVEHLVASINGRVCAQAESEGFVAAPHYSPGYNGWDVSDQAALFEVIHRGHRDLPETLAVLPSGMLVPKKALLGVIGLAPRSAARRIAIPAVPCAGCSFTPCQFRRVPYRHALDGATHPVNGTIAPAASPARYSVNVRALEKWSQERVRLDRDASGALIAWFRFDGTTCSNLGRPLSFLYRVGLEPARNGHAVSPASRAPVYRITTAECRPVEGDDGYRSMCEYLRDPDELMAAIERETPLVGHSLSEVLTWERRAAPTGCYCDAESRAHKWRLALEAIHYALEQAAVIPSAAN